MVRKGQFREDLYYRLNVVTLKIPPLRERVEDIPVLIENFLHEFTFNHHKEPPAISEKALALCMNYQWPGNIRELRNVVERMVILIDNSSIEPEDLRLIMPQIEGEANQGRRAQEKNQLEKERIVEALLETYGNKSAAAKLLGISRVSLY